MIANARMYSTSPAVAELWRELFVALIQESGLDIAYAEHAAPAPLEDLWRRDDLAAVFMCGLPYVRAERMPTLIAAPVPCGEDFGDAPRYWSDFVVRGDGPIGSLEESFGGRIAFTGPSSQSGYAAALHFLIAAGGGPGAREPLYREVIAPQITPRRAVQAVIEGAADIAPIDAYALALMRRFEPEALSGLRVVARTAPKAIPVLVASDERALALIPVLLRAHERENIRALLARLMLRRFARPDPAAYADLLADYRTAMRYWRGRPLAASVHPAFL